MKKIIAILIIISTVITSLFIVNKINRKQEESTSMKIEPILIGNTVASYENILTERLILIIFII